MDTCPVAPETRELDGGAHGSCHMYDERCSLRSGDLVKPIMICDGYIERTRSENKVVDHCLTLMDLMVWRSKSEIWTVVEEGLYWLASEPVWCSTAFKVGGESGKPCGWTTGRD